MNDISQLKLLRPWTWIGRRKKAPIVLPPETLAHILHYFPRKQLVKRYSRVNSSFFQVSSRLPNVHVIKDNNLCFSLKTVPEDKTYVQTFESFTLGKYQNSYSRFRKALNKITKKRITAAEYLKNMPPAFIRFPKFSISYRPDEVLLKFLRDSKQHFVNCRLYFHSSNPDEKYLQKVKEMLSDTFLNPVAITFSYGIASEKFFKTTGARNCDKVEICIANIPKCTKDTFMDWIQWKQNQSGSRRHLVLIGCQLALTATQEMLEDLKYAFETATKPLSYVITFAHHYNDEAENPSEFHLDNERTGERLSLFRDKQHCFRLWRRTVTSSDSTWLSALIGGKRMEKEVRESANETGFDEELALYILCHALLCHCTYCATPYCATGQLCHRFIVPPDSCATIEISRKLRETCRDFLHPGVFDPAESEFQIRPRAHCMRVTRTACARHPPHAYRIASGARSACMQCARGRI
ncbi:hypothetical protein DdX_18341 [Ditylenchus destructor]|uniref:F-box domain-containing protein n=1 Tax=Ditylenchus destructor TaxID=166010 RepID=A0AAD4MKG0_9BILA|nr:hypothetical protein DdX_18341 [Ditylenchus destructor]